MRDVTIAQGELDELWDFSNPALSERRLREAAAGTTDATRRGELETQVARSLGLQERYAEADAVLEGIESPDPAVRVRIALESGRLRNSSGDPRAATALFESAAAGAASAGLDFLQVDALHMLAIADVPHAERWTRLALALLDRVEDPRTLRWRVGLHNNAGWALFDEGRFPEALLAFERSKEAAVQWGTSQQVRWADEAIAEAKAAAAPQG